MILLKLRNAIRAKAGFHWKVGGIMEELELDTSEDNYTAIRYNKYGNYVDLIQASQHPIYGTVNSRILLELDDIDSIVEFLRGVKESI